MIRKLILVLVSLSIIALISHGDYHALGQRVVPRRPSDVDIEARNRIRHIEEVLSSVAAKQDLNQLQLQLDKVSATTDSLSKTVDRLAHSIENLNDVAEAKTVALGVKRRLDKSVSVGILIAIATLVLSLWSILLTLFFRPSRAAVDRILESLTVRLDKLAKELSRVRVDHEQLARLIKHQEP